MVKDRMEFSSRIIYEEYNIVSSTNDVVKWYLLDSLEDKSPKRNIIFVVRSDEQSQGRGSQGRTWVSQRGGLFMSWGKLIERHVREDLAVYVTDQLISFFYDEFRLNVERKGINDVFLNEKKLGGILIEVVFSGEVPRGVIIGVGINVMNPCQRYEKYASTNFMEAGISMSARDLGFKLLPVFLDIMDKL